MIDLLLNFVSTLSERFVELLLAPINYPETLWMVIPVLFTLFLVELYFGRYKAEEIGWNSAFGNSLVLIFVSIDMIRLLYNQQGLEAFIYINPKMALIIAVVVEGVALTLIAFYHVLPKNIAFNFSSALPMNFIAYMSILLVYTNIKIDFYTVLAAFGLMTLLVFVLLIIKIIEPKSYDVTGLEKHFRSAPTPKL
jgi:hypothetical protein